MLRRWAAVTMMATCACSGVRTTDPPAAAGSMAPRLSHTGDRIVLSWVEPDSGGVPALRFAERNGDAWGAAKTVIQDPLLAADSADIPSVVPTGDGGLAAHWTVKRNGAPHARDVLVAVSRDGGATWSRPARPHRDDSESEHGMATIVPTGPGEAFGICWLDGRSGATSEYGEGGTSLYWADHSGEAFGPEVLLDPRVCDCCKTSAVRGAQGPLVAYRDRDESERRDISVLNRGDAAWSAPRPVRGDGWSLSACPTNGPSIAANGTRAAVAWFTGADAKPSVWVSQSADGGRSFGAAVRIDGGAPLGRVEAAVLADGSIAVVWLERSGKNAAVRVRRIAPEDGLGEPVIVARTSPARASGYPSITATGDRNVLVAWIEAGSRNRVRAATVTLR